MSGGGDKRVWDRFCEECEELGGVPEPLPCDWYNSYCEDTDECVYYSIPILYDPKYRFYCCREVKGHAGN